MLVYRAAEKTLDYVNDHRAVFPVANGTMVREDSGERPRVYVCAQAISFSLFILTFTPSKTSAAGGGKASVWKQTNLFLN